MGMAGAFAGVFATGHLIALADEWSSVNARLKQASTSTDDFSIPNDYLWISARKQGQRSVITQVYLLDRQHQCVSLVIPLAMY